MLSFDREGHWTCFIALTQVMLFRPALPAILPRWMVVILGMFMLSNTSIEAMLLSQTFRQMMWGKVMWQISFNNSAWLFPSSSQHQVHANSHLTSQCLMLFISSLCSIHYPFTILTLPFTYRHFFLRNHYGFYYQSLIS